VGTRRRSQIKSQYSVEEQALDHIAKEVSVILFFLSSFLPSSFFAAFELLLLFLDLQEYSPPLGISFKLVLVLSLEEDEQVHVREELQERETPTLSIIQRGQQ
jgi:hypothetical protein